MATGIGRFYALNKLSVQTNQGEHFYFVTLFVCSIKTSTRRRIMRLDKLRLVIRLGKKKNSLYGNPSSAIN